MLGGEVDLIDSVMFLVFLLALIVGFSLIHFFENLLERAIDYGEYRETIKKQEETELEREERRERYKEWLRKNC